MNDVVDVTNGAFRERVRDVPSRAPVGRRVDVDFIPHAVVEVLSPKYCAAGNRGDVQRACAAEEGVSRAELGFARWECNDRSRNGGDESA